MTDIDDCTLLRTPDETANEAVVETPVVPTPPKVASTRSLPVARATMDRWREEEPDLIRAWQDKGDERALETLLKRYRSLFAKQISRILAGRAVTQAHRADLEQEAHLAFVKAVTKFDFNAGTKLSTFAQTHVRNAMLRYSLDFRNSYRIGTSSHERKAYYAALSVRARRISKGESEQLTDEDIATIQTRTGANEAATRRAVDAIYSSQSGLDAALDIACDSGGEARSETEMAVSSVMDMLRPFVAGLCERKQAIFAQMSGASSKDNHQIAEDFGLTVERIGQLRRELISELAKRLKAEGITAEDVF